MQLSTWRQHTHCRTAMTYPSHNTIGKVLHESNNVRGLGASVSSCSSTGSSCCRPVGSARQHYCITPHTRLQVDSHRQLTVSAAAAAAAGLSGPGKTATGRRVHAPAVLQQKCRSVSAHSTPLPAAAAAAAQRSNVVVAAASAGGGKGGSPRDDDIWQQLSSMADKYLFAGAPSPASRSSSGSSSKPLPMQAIHILLCCYIAMWLLTAVPISNSGPLIPPKLLSLDQISSSSSSWLARLACPLTDAFSSGSTSSLLARNLFFGYMFGRVVENTESNGALWLTFLMSALGGSLACVGLLPRRAPLQGCAATAALFGLFSAATLFNRHKQWHWQRVFELLVLLPFTVQQMLWGHQGLTQWCSLMGFRLPGAWVPLLGGVLGAAVAAGVLALVRALQEGVAAQQRQQQQRERERQGGGRDGGGEGKVPMSVLLARAAAQLLRNKLGS